MQPVGDDIDFGWCDSNDRWGAVARDRGFRFRGGAGGGGEEELEIDHVRVALDEELMVLEQRYRLGGRHGGWERGGVLEGVCGVEHGFGEMMTFSASSWGPGMNLIKEMKSRSIPGWCEIACETAFR